MSKTSVNLVEKNLSIDCYCLEQFEALLHKEGTEALKKQWEQIKKPLLRSDTLDTSSTGDPDDPPDKERPDPVDLPLST